MSKNVWTFPLIGTWIMCFQYFLYSSYQTFLENLSNEHYTVIALCWCVVGITTFKCKTCDVEDSQSHHTSSNSVNIVSYLYECLLLCHWLLMYRICVNGKVSGENDSKIGLHVFSHYSRLLTVIDLCLNNWAFKKDDSVPRCLADRSLIKWDFHVTTCLFHPSAVFADICCVTTLSRV